MLNIRDYYCIAFKLHMASKYAQGVEADIFYTTKKFNMATHRPGAISQIDKILNISLSMIARGVGCIKVV